MWNDLLAYISENPQAVGGTVAGIITLITGFIIWRKDR